MKKYAVYLITLLLAFAVALNYMKLFTADVRESKLNYEYDRMSEIADVYGDNIKKSIKIYIDFTSSAAAAISTSGGINQETAHNFLENMVDNTDFISASVTFSDGTYIMAVENGLKIPPPSPSVPNISGTGMHIKTIDGKKYLVINAAVTKNGRSTDMNIRGLLPASYIERIVSRTVFEKGASACLLNKNGDVMLYPPSEKGTQEKLPANIFAWNENKKCLDHKNESTKAKNMLALGKDVLFKPNCKNLQRIFFIKPLDIGDWCVAVVLPQSYIDEAVFPVVNKAGYLVIQIFLLFTAMLSCIIWRERSLAKKTAAAAAVTESLIRSTPGGFVKCRISGDYPFEYMSDGFAKLASCESVKDTVAFYKNSLWNSIAEQDRETASATIKAQLNESKSINVTYRMNRKDGESIYVMNRGGLAHEDSGEKDTAYGVIVDVTDMQKAISDLRVSEKRYKIATSQANLLIFEYNPQDDTVTFSENTSKKFGYPPVLHNALSGDLSEYPFLYAIHSLTGTENTFSDEYELRSAEGEVVYVKATLTAIFEHIDKLLNVMGIIEDITEHKKIQMKCQERERYKNTLSKLYERYYEFDITNDAVIAGYDTMSDAQKTVSKGYFEMEAQFMEHDLHPDDRITYAPFATPYGIKQLWADGITDSNIKYRVIEKDGSYRWKDAHITIFREASDSSLRTMWFTKDINTLMIKEEELENRAKRDRLTQLYNKVTAETLISEHLKNHSGDTENTKSAFIIIDLDHFKDINDSMGHMFGDAVITESAKKISDTFKTTDIIGRIGGDEFVVFMKDIQDRELTVKKAYQLAKSIETMSKGGTEDIHISACIGISFSHGADTTFNEMYNKADIALYHSKDKGKGKVTVYDDSMGLSVLKKDNAIIPIENKTEGSFTDEPARYVFRMLYGAKNLSVALTGVFELVISHFKLSRGYIFENSLDRKRFTEILEISVYDVPTMMDRFKNKEYAYWRPNYEKNFDDNGLFIMDINNADYEQIRIFEPQSIHYMLQTAIYDEGIFRGFIGFDICDSERPLSPEDVENLSLIAKVIVLFVKREFHRNSRDLRVSIYKNAMDSVTVPMCAVKSDTFELLYANKEAIKTAGREPEETKCFSYLFGRSLPCPECPLLNSGDNDRKACSIPADWDIENDVCIVACRGFKKSAEELS